MLKCKRFLTIFIVSLAVITATFSFKTHETSKVIELGRIHQSGINGFRFSPDGKIIATSNDQEVTLWNLEAEPIQKLSSDTTRAKINSFVFSPDGRLIVTASNTRVTLWNTQGEQLWTSPFITQNYNYDIPNLPVINFHPDGQMIVALGNKEVKVWNLNGEEIQTLHHEETIETFRFSPDGQIIATLSRQEVKLWSRYGEELQSLKRSDLTTPLRFYTKGIGSFDYVGFTLDGRTVITIDTGNVNLWSQDGKLLRNLSTLMAGSVVPNSNNTAILTTHPQGAKLWDYEGKLLASLGPQELNDMKESRISWSPDNQIVATAGTSGVNLWTVEDGKRIQTLPRISLLDIFENIDHHFCDAVSFSSNGQIIAALCRFPGTGVFSPGVFKNGLRLWSRDGQELWTPDENAYDSYVFNPDSQTIVIKHEGQLILLKLSVSKR